MGQPTFSGTKLELSVSQYGQECVPEIYTMFVNGVAAFTTMGSSFEGTFNGFTVSDDASSGINLVTVGGEVSSPCLGGDTLFRTRTHLAIATGSACPSSGEQWVDHGADFSITDLIRYQASSIAIDYGYDESIDVSFESCLDPRLLVCPAV